MRLIILFLVPFLVANVAFAEPNAELVYKLKASVVKVHSFTKNGGHGIGSGVVVGKDLVATNCHVLANATGASISKFGESFSPVALKADWKHDLCILRFEYLEMTPIELGDSESLKYEQEIFSIGFPGGPPKPQTTSGKIKALYPLDDSEIVRTDASFMMGASGSPVFDSEGKLIAISTFKSPGKGAYFYNMPVKWVKALLDAPETTSMKTDETPFWDAPEDKMPFFMRVVLSYQNEEWAELSKIAQLWLNKEPNSVEAHYYLGVAEEKLGQAPMAKNEFAQTLKLNPQHLATLFELGLIANKEGDQPELERVRVALKEIDADMLDSLNNTINPKSEIDK